MIYLKENPVGIDKKIQSIQSYLHEKLSGFNIEAFGRVEVYDNKLISYTKKNDYKEALFINEKTNGRFFFIDNETTKVVKKEAKTDVEIIFLLDLNKITSKSDYRADEEIKIQILEVLKNRLNRGVEIEITKGIEALKGFETKLKHLHPFYFLKFGFELEYKINNEC